MDKQHKNYTCGAACVEAYLHFCGIDKSEEKIATWLGTNPKTGTHPTAISSWFKKMGLLVEAGESNIESLIAHVRKDHLAMCLMQAPGYEPTGSNGHWVLVYGYDGKNFLLFDPDVGETIELPIREFETRWFDTHTVQKEVKLWNAWAAVIRMPRDGALPTEQLATKDLSGKSITEQMVSGLLEASTYSDLQSNTVDSSNFSTKKRQYATDPVDIVDYKLIPYTSSKKMLAKMTASSDSKKYDLNINFQSIKFVGTKREGVQFTGADGQTYFVKPVDLDNVYVKVRCTCLDFYWRFAYYDKKDSSLFGQGPKPYVKKTDRKPGNINKVPGLCKHLMAGFRDLKQLGIVQ